MNWMKENGIFKNLSREEWLHLAGSGPQQAPPEGQDVLSSRAIRGLQYAESPEALQRSLTRLDHRIDLLIKGGVGKKPRRSIRYLPSSLRFAAAGLILCLAATAVWISLRGHSGPQLYAAYFEPLDSAIPQTGNVRGTPAASDLRAQALLDYENGRYDAAIPKFRQHLKGNESDAAARLYFGISLLAADQAAQAKDQLSLALEAAAEQFLPATAWYLALAHLRLNEREPAIGHLRKLADSAASRFYGRQAESLLQDLNAGGDAR